MSQRAKWFYLAIAVTLMAVGLVGSYNAIGAEKKNKWACVTLIKLGSISHSAVVVENEEEADRFLEAFDQVAKAGGLQGGAMCAEMKAVKPKPRGADGKDLELKKERDS